MSLNYTWEQSATLAYSHSEFGFSYHEQLGLVISGSKSGSGANKVETTVDGQNIQVQCINFVLNIILHVFG